MDVARMELITHAFLARQPFGLSIVLLENGDFV